MSEPETEAVSPPLQDQTYKARLSDGTIIGSGDTEQVAVQVACAYYTAYMIRNPQRPFQIGVYNGTGTLQAVVGRGV